MPRAQPKRIKAVITDLGGVLVNVDVQRMCAGFSRYSLLPQGEVAKHFDHAVITGHEIEFGKGLISPKQFYGLISKELKLKNLGFDGFCRIFCGIFSRKNGSIGVIRALGKKYAVAMLSNTNEMHFRSLEKLLSADMNLFKEVVLSFQLGIAKPDARIFLEAARRLGVEPQQCVYIDDVEEYVEAARKVGMKGIRFVSAQQLQKDLAGIGVTA